MGDAPIRFSFQTTDPGTNAVVGSANEPVDIGPGASQAFAIALTAEATVAPTTLTLEFDCANTDPAPILDGVNTLRFSASLDARPDIIALASAWRGIVNLMGISGTGVFSVAAVNLGAPGIRVAVDTNGVDLPIHLRACRTDPATSLCMEPGFVVPSHALLETAMGTDETASFAVFVEAKEEVAFDPAKHRIYLRFLDEEGVERGSTSVAVAADWVLSECDGPPSSRRDRLDDSSLPQVHIIYAVPADGIDRELDTNGVLARSVDAFNRWLAARASGRRLRIDTCDGAVDISFVRLSRPDASYRSYGAHARDEIEAEIAARGYDAQNKLYAVYYEGSSDFACSDAPLPPSRVGNTVVLFLNGRSSSPTPCSSSPFTDTNTDPGAWGFATLREIFHALGAVPECAPNHISSGQTSDDPEDLMYAATFPWQPTTLDAGRDDYFSHANSTCTDLEDSLFLDPAKAGAELPPGWPIAPSLLRN